MQTWWEGLTTVQQILYCIAIPSTLVLILQMILSMIGGEADGGVDVSDTSGLGTDTDVLFDTEVDLTPDAAGDVFTDGGNPMDFANLKFLTLQTIITFLTVFSWVSLVCISSGLGVTTSILIGTAVGLVMMFLVAKLVQLSSKLAENGTLNLRNAIGETAAVYLTIPAHGGGEGKVTLQVQGRFGEFDAITEESVPLETGMQVLVTDVRGDTLVVERSTSVPE